MVAETGGDAPAFQPDSTLPSAPVLETGASMAANMASPSNSNPTTTPHTGMYSAAELGEAEVAVNVPSPANPATPAVGPVQLPAENSYAPMYGNSNPTGTVAGVNTPSSAPATSYQPATTYQPAAAYNPNIASTAPGVTSPAVNPVTYPSTGTAGYAIPGATTQNPLRVNEPSGNVASTNLGNSNTAVASAAPSNATPYRPGGTSTYSGMATSYVATLPEAPKDDIPSVTLPANYGSSNYAPTYPNAQ